MNAVAAPGSTLYIVTDPAKAAEARPAPQALNAIEAKVVCAACTRLTPRGAMHAYSITRGAMHAYSIAQRP